MSTDTPSPAPTPNAVIDANAYQLAMQQLMGGKSNIVVRSNLVASGVPEDIAATIVRDLSGKIRDAKRKRARRDILVGGLFFVGGLVITLITYSNASHGGGRYVVTWGAIIFGGIQFFRGLATYFGD